MKPNLVMSANVIGCEDPNTNKPLSSKQVIAVLPGDFAVQVYKGLWPNKETIRANLSDRQRFEYEQYLVCLKCGRACAGLCGGRL